MDPVENFYDYDELEGPEEERYRRKQMPQSSPLKDKTGSTECLYNPDTHSSDALSTLTAMRASKDLVDVTIEAGDLSLNAHRSILAACSPYFRAMFSGDNRESKEGVVVVKGLDPVAVKDLIDFCYSGKVKIDTTNVLHLLPAACFLQLAGVQDACCLFLTSQLHPSNCLGFRKFADLHHCVSLWKKCNVFIQQRFPEVALQGEFLDLTFEELSEIIADDHLNVRGEEQVFEAAMAWVKHRLDERKALVPNLLQHIRMQLMSAAYLSRVVKSELLVMESFQGRGFLIESMDYHLQRHYMKDTTRTLNAAPRCCPGLEYLFAVGGSGPPVCEEDPYLDLCECYDLDKNEWRLMAPMSMKRSGVRVATAGGYVFVLGGFSASDTKALSAVDRYDPMTDSWRTMAPMIYPRRSFGVAVLNGYIYAMGGINGGTYYDSVERYCSKSNKWTLVHPMSVERRAVCSTALDGYIYAAGGHDGDGLLDSVERYDPQRDTWAVVTTLSSRRCLGSLAALKGFLYAVGGYDGASVLQCLQRYNPVTGVWTNLSPLPMERSGFSTGVVNGMLYIVGGCNNLSKLNLVDRYDPEKDEWNSVAKMSVRRSGLGVAVAPAFLF